MKSIGINFVRLPLGYWNVVDMTDEPVTPIASESKRLGNLAKIMPAKEYRPYIDKVFDYAAKWDL